MWTRRNWATWLQLPHIHAGRRRLQKLPKFHFLSLWLYINRKSQQLWINTTHLSCLCPQQKRMARSPTGLRVHPKCCKRALIPSLRSACSSLSPRFVGHFQNPISVSKNSFSFLSLRTGLPALDFTHAFHSSLPALCFLLRNDHKTNAIFLLFIVELP